MHLSKTLDCLGYLDQARARREAALAEARQLTHAYTLALALLMCLYTERGQRTADARLPLAEELSRLPFAKSTAKGPPFSMRGVPAIAANPRLKTTPVLG